MKSIIICCSIAIAEEVVKIERELIAMGFDVAIPYGVQKYKDNNNTH
jgi:hypothetical protein